MCSSPLVISSTKSYISSAGGPHPFTQGIWNVPILHYHLDLHGTNRLWSSFYLTRFNLPSPWVINYHHINHLSVIHCCSNSFYTICSSWSNTCCASCKHANSLRYHLPVIRIVNFDFKGVAWIIIQSKLSMCHNDNMCHGCTAWIVITNESAIGCMSLWTTMQILQVRRPDRCRISAGPVYAAGHGTGQTEMDGWTAALLIAPLEWAYYYYYYY